MGSWQLAGARRQSRQCRQVTGRWEVRDGRENRELGEWSEWDGEGESLTQRRRDAEVGDGESLTQRRRDAEVGDGVALSLGVVGSSVSVIHARETLEMVILCP